MFKENTIFVIGAGASAEYKNFPVGRGLREAIQKNSAMEGVHASSVVSQRIFHSLCTSAK
jgi:hypothetical protein